MSAPRQGWLAGAPMDPTAAPAERVAATPGFPFAHPAASAVIVGATGGGRSALIQACMYDAARAGQRCAYLAGEINRGEFDARAAALAARRGDTINPALRKKLAAARYLDLAPVVARAWREPEPFIEGIVAAYDIVAIDPLSSVASVLDLDFDRSNADYVRVFDRLILPLTSHGLTVVLVENIGHDPDSKRRAKGASAKGDRADLTFACAPCASPVGLVIRAEKVRSVRAPFDRGDEWLFDRDTQRVTARRGETTTPEPFRPTEIMERVSRLVEHDDDLSANSIRAAVGGRSEYVTLALQLLIAEGYIEQTRDGQTHRHHSLKPYTASTESQPGPDRVPDPAPGTRSTESHPRRGGHGTGPGTNGNSNTATESLLASAIAEAAT